MKTFYRICNTETQQGCWYDFSGKFTGLIHNEFDFCKNYGLKMDFDEELVGWLSATDSLDTLYNWFTQEDILKLQEFGWYIHEYRTDNYKWYDTLQHWVIKQDSSDLVTKIKI